MIKNLVFIFVCLIHCSCFAQENKIKRFNLKFSPQQRLMNTYLFSGEYIFERQGWQSINISLGKTYNQLIYNNNQSYTKERGVVFAFEYRYYFHQSANKGVYVAPNLKVDYLKSDFKKPIAFGISILPDSTTQGIILASQENIQTIYSTAIGGHIGFQYIFLRHCIIDLYIGLAYRHSYSIYQYNKDISGYLYPIYAYQGWLEKSVIDKTYNGLLPKLGFQIGFAF